MKELKPGMLCLVIGARKVHSNIGKVVELISFVREGEEVIKPDVNKVRLALGVGNGWLVVGNVSASPVGEGYAFMDAKNLMPLDSDGEPESLSADEERTVKVGDYE